MPDGQRRTPRTLDLNLLVIFDAVAQERSATRAAAKLNMAQPAISHALSRLRSALRDDLFVRTPDGMEPTPFAERLADPVRSALESLRTALDHSAEFHPASAERGFLVTAMLWHRRLDDVSAHRWLRSLVRRVAHTV